jgi:hypothetical protein
MRFYLVLITSGAVACSSSNGGSAADETATDSSATQSQSQTDGESESAESDGETESGSGSGGTEPLPGCEDPVSGSARPFEVWLTDIPQSDDTLELTLDCEVLSVALQGSMISTDLACLGDEAEPRAATLDVRAPDEGSPAWQAGEAISLSVLAVPHYGGLLDDPTVLGYDVQHVAMHRLEDGMLLAAGTNGPGIASALYDPVQVAIDRDACGVDVSAEDSPGPDRNMAVTFTLDDEALTLLGGHAGELLVGADWLAIDLASARAMECCHGNQWLVAVASLMTE